MNKVSNSVFNIITSTSTKKKLFCFLKNTKTIHDLLFSLKNLGIIYGYYFIPPKKKYCVVLKQNIFGQPTIKKIIIWSTPGRQIFVSVSQLNSIYFKNALTETLLATDKGIINAKKALCFNIGGLLLCRIII